jgi:Tfp pilus assembly protein PilN
MLCLIGVAVWLPSSIVDHYQQHLTVINAEIAKLDPAESYYHKMSSLQKQLDTNKKAVEHIESKQQPITELLQQINEILPSNCSISYLELKDQGEFILEVVTNNPVDTAKILVGLRNLGLFQQVALSEVGGSTTGKGEVPFINPESEQQQVRFNLKLKGYDEGTQKDED